MAPPGAYDPGNFALLGVTITRPQTSNPWRGTDCSVTAGVRGGVGNGDRHAARSIAPSIAGGCNAPQVLPAMWRLANARGQRPESHRTELCHLWLGLLPRRPGPAANTILTPQPSNGRAGTRQGLRASVAPHRLPTRNGHLAPQSRLAGVLERRKQVGTAHAADSGYVGSFGESLGHRRSGQGGQASWSGSLPGRESALSAGAYLQLWVTVSHR